MSYGHFVKKCVFSRCPMHPDIVARTDDPLLHRIRLGLQSDTDWSLLASDRRVWHVVTRAAVWERPIYEDDDPDYHPWEFDKTDDGERFRGPVGRWYYDEDSGKYRQEDS